MSSASPRALAWACRADAHAAGGVLQVWRAPPAALPASPGQPPSVPSDPAEGPELLLALCDDGWAVGLHGHVDLGTGLATALAQLVAEELDLNLDQVRMILGSTALAPNQGPTIASGSIQVHGQPLRQAAAQARAWLVAAAATRWGLPVADLRADGGQVIAFDGRRMAYADLVAGGHAELLLDSATPLKPVAQHRVVGQSLPRVDIAAKLAGELGFVHDVRLPGMLHGRVLRPPYAGMDAGDFVGRSLRGVDEASIAHLPGIVRLVVIADFIGVVAEREEQAQAAVATLRCDWAPYTPLASLDDLAQALSAHPSTARVVAQQGEVDAALSAAAQRLDRDYVWPYQLHASIGPSCAVADWHAPDAAGHSATVWTGSQNPHVLRADLARLTGLASPQINVLRLEASGCYGRNGADDVAADALLLARAVGRPVRVQLTREQEHLWEPKGAAQLMQVRGGLDAAGAPLAYDFATSYPSNGAPTLALLLTGAVPASPQAFEMGDRTAVPPYAYAHQRITVNDMAPILRASWLRGVSALPNSFAHESYVDELAHAAGADPLDYRLGHLNDERAAELLRATAARAGWRPHTQPQQQGSEGAWLQGQGLAYARYIHSKFPGHGAAWAAWVADVAVHPVTGEVHVKRVVVGQDAGLMVNPLGVTHQVHGNVLQTTSRALKERLAIDPMTQLPESAEWGSYPILNFREVPVVDVLLMPRPGEPPLGVGESASVPGTAAIANAIFDATGVRLRQPPFTPEVVRAAMNGLPAPTTAAAPPPALQPVMAVGPAKPWPPVADPQRRRKPRWAVAGALVGAAMGLGAALLGWRPAIAPVAASSAGVYSPGLIERGRQLAALGNCMHCHTTEGGVPGAGGRALATPFGEVVSTNLTPDPATGIGAWSFSAFQRAMREGLSRDGHRLYPAFPYTAFSQASDDELTALYAWLMVQPPVVHAVPASTLRFPFNIRPLMGLWNAWVLQPGPVPTPAPAAVAERSAQWRRGAALVNGLGHCTACHTPRSAMGAERNDRQYLAGAVVDGWEAPALGALSASPVPWTEAALLRYLRQGHDPAHGIAGGPMAPVVRALAQADETDVQAMAHYLVAQQLPRPALAPEARVARAAARAGALLPSPAQRLFESACGACHHEGKGPQTLGLNLALALNTNLHGARPDNLVRTVLQGIAQPAFPAIGHMPAFGPALSDRQIAELAGWMRQRYAPDQPAWADLTATVARLRALPP